MNRKAARHRHRQPRPSGPPTAQETHAQITRAQTEGFQVGKYAREEAVSFVLATLDPLPILLKVMKCYTIEEAVRRSKPILDESDLRFTQDLNDIFYLWQVEGMPWTVFERTFPTALHHALTERTRRLQGTNEEAFVGTHWGTRVRLYSPEMCHALTAWTARAPLLADDQEREEAALYIPSEPTNALQVLRKSLEHIPAEALAQSLLGT